MASVQQWIIGITLFAVALLTGYFLTWVGGLTLDWVYNNGTALGPPQLVDQIKTTDFYQQTNGVGIVFKVNLAYLLCYALPVLGAWWIWMSLVKYQSYDSYSLLGESADQRTSRRMRRRRVR
jgi:hypothetical protein